MRRNLRFGFLALALLVTFGLSGPSDRDAAALVCRSTCNSLLQGCLTGFLYPLCHGDPICCANVTASCFHNSNPNC